MSVAAPSRYLELRMLAPLENMRFTTRQRIEGSYSGRHRSKQQGGAGEFVDYREYSEGEDLRKLDWKVLARSGRAYVRLYQDETNLLCTLAVDGSGSMQFGGPGGVDKLVYAKYLATALSHVISRGQDQVGLAVLGSRLREVLPPRGTATHITLLQETIERIEPQPTLRMAESLRELFERVTRRGVLLVMSDFLMDDWEDVFAALRLFRHRQWEILALHLVHPAEERLPEGIAFRFEGLEQDGSINCSPAEIRDAYQARFEAHAAAVRALALAVGCDYRRISTGENYVQSLRGFLVERTG